MAMRQQLAGQSPMARRRPAHAILRHLVLYTVCLGAAAVAMAAHEHYKLSNQGTPALVSLVIAGGFALVPFRALLGALFGVERSVLHLVHGIGALAFVGLGAGGLITGAPVLSHAATAPFAIMGAAQALMHQDHPRNAQQGAAIREFASSLPEVTQFTSGGDLTSPANAKRAIVVLTDLIGKAQVLGQTELQSDPGFQNALSQVTTHFGLNLGLDAITQAVHQLANNPAAASAIPGLEQQLAAARQTAAAAH
jgi:hypothetical protein